MLLNADGRNLHPPWFFWVTTARWSSVRRSNESRKSRQTTSSKPSAADGNKEYFVVYQNEATAEFISALILKNEADGEKEIGPITNAVICVPTISTTCRKARRMCGPV